MGQSTEIPWFHGGLTIDGISCGFDGKLMGISKVADCWKIPVA